MILIPLNADYNSTQILGNENLSLLKATTFSILWTTSAATKDGVFKLYAVLDSSGVRKSLIDTINITTATGDELRHYPYLSTGYIIEYTHNTIDGDGYLTVDYLIELV